MKKKAWPWIGSEEKEMGAETSREKDSQERSTFAIGESHNPMPEPFGYGSGGIISPPQEDYAKDKDKKESTLSVDIYSDEDILATFSCDIAKTMQQKIAGLQTYDNLSESAGLVFEYSRPEDVVYHMGSVKFPIDILFIDKNDKIKKIYRNIQPGTLATFGCADVKNVLEICGGLSDRLGLCHGNRVSFSSKHDAFSKKIGELNKISKNFGSKNIIIKYSTLGNNSVSSWKSFPILNVNNNIVKTASKNRIFSNFISNVLKPSKKEIHIFDFDGLIEQSPTIRVYKVSEDTEVDRPYRKLGGHTASIIKNASGQEVYKDLNVEAILSKGLKKDAGIIISLNKSLDNFMKTLSNDDFKMLSALRKVSYDKKSKPIVVTRFPNPKYLKEIIASKYNLHFGEYPNFEIQSIPKDSGANDIINSFRKKYGNQDYKIYTDPTILKRAGVPVPDDTKNMAKDVYKKLENAFNLSNESLDGLKKNVEEYNKLNEKNPEAIKNTKGQYNQSCKNNREKFKNILIDLRDSIKILNNIKDSTITPQVIESLTSSAKSSSDSIDEVFNLLEQITSPEFINILTQKTTAYEKTIEDLKSSIDKGKKHINSDILGLVILSD